MEIKFDEKAPKLHFKNVMDFISVHGGLLGQI